MKSAFNLFRSLPVAHRFVVLAELVAVIALALVLSMGDAKAQAGNVYANPQVQSPGETFAGVVVQVMVKQSEPSGTDRAAGAAVGGSIGALVGSRIGSDNRFAVNALSAVIGGIVGERATNVLFRSEAQEIIVQLEPQGGQQPKMITVVQPAPFDRIFAGEAVFVTVTRGVYRVIPVQRHQPPQM